jgi:predicted DNA-binding protein with PD1-like motif
LVGRTLARTGWLKSALFECMLIIPIMIQAQKDFQAVPSAMKTCVIRLQPGQDLKRSLDDYVKANHIEAACILTCVGSLQKAVIRYANQPDAVTLERKFEIVSLTGTLAESGSHVHISLSDEQGKTIGGHLKEGSEVYTTAEIVLGILTDVEFKRVEDPLTGYKELWIAPK